MEWTRRDLLRLSAAAMALGVPGGGGLAQARQARPGGAAVGREGEGDRYDVVIIGGGPAGLSGALALGRAVRRVLLVDGGAPRNAAAAAVHNFVTRDGVPPAEFRRIARAQLAPYAVDFAERVAVAVTGEPGRFEVTFEDGAVACRRVLVCVGMVDELLSMPGYRELWGASIFQCPYCHGWERRGRPWGVLADSPEMAAWASFLTAWTPDVTVFTSGAFALAEETRAELTRRGVKVEDRAIARLVPAANSGQGEQGAEPALEAVELEGGERVPCEALLSRPPQRQTAFVQSLGLALDEAGFVAVNERMATSRPGIYAAGDLCTRMQSALGAASAGQLAASVLNHELWMA